MKAFQFFSLSLLTGHKIDRPVIFYGVITFSGFAKVYFYFSGDVKIPRGDARFYLIARFIRHL